MMMQATRKRSILRLLIILLLVAVGAGFLADLYLKDLLPPTLAAFVKADDDSELTSPELIAFVILAIAVVAYVVALAGLWWCRRWARWVFTIVALTGPLVEGLTGLAYPTTLVLNSVEAMFNIVGHMLDGAILALIWLGMSAEFDR